MAALIGDFPHKNQHDLWLAMVIINFVPSYSEIPLGKTCSCLKWPYPYIKVDKNYDLDKIWLILTCTFMHALTQRTTHPYGNCAAARRLNKKDCFTFLPTTLPCIMHNKALNFHWCSSYAKDFLQCFSTQGQ